MPHILEVVAPYLEVAADIVTVAGLIFLVLALNRVWKNIRQDQKSRKKISITLPKELQAEDLHYYVRHIRDGDSDNRMVSRDISHRMNKEDGGRYSATIEYIQGFGFEFKCYVDTEKPNFKDIVTLFEKADDIKRVGQDAENSQRLWLLLEDYEERKTDSGYFNNYYGSR